LFAKSTLLKFDPKNRALQVEIAKGIMIATSYACIFTKEIRGYKRDGSPIIKSVWLAEKNRKIMIENYDIAHNIVMSIEPTYDAPTIERKMKPSWWDR
jgi:hypothetical protein